MQGGAKVEIGMKVRSSDGEKLGKVVSCDSGGFIIEKGFFFPKEYSARFDQVADYREGELWLTEAADELKRGLAREPMISEQGGMGRRETTAAEQVRVPLSEEQLIAEKRMHKAGEVEIHKEVITEQKQVSVPVMKEEIHVERVPASREAQPSEASFRESTVSVPAYEEEVEIRKRPVVREEVRVSKGAHEEERRAMAETQRESAEVRTKGEIDEKD
jgi:uncharacterized protein (TIGR02271 family)